MHPFPALHGVQPRHPDVPATTAILRSRERDFGVAIGDLVRAPPSAVMAFRGQARLGDGRVSGNDEYRVVGVGDRTVSVFLRRLV